jgi:YD repeat-containing protein
MQWADHADLRPERPLALYDYDQDGSLVHFTDRSGSVTSFAYDGFHRVRRCGPAHQADLSGRELHPHRVQRDRQAGVHLRPARAKDAVRLRRPGAAFDHHLSGPDHLGHQLRQERPAEDQHRSRRQDDILRLRRARPAYDHHLRGLDLAHHRIRRGRPGAPQPR